MPPADVFHHAVKPNPRFTAHATITGLETAHSQSKSPPARHQHTQTRSRHAIGVDGGGLNAVVRGQAAPNAVLLGQPVIMLMLPRPRNP
jgi:hypothetical protein